MQFGLIEEILAINSNYNGLIHIEKAVEKSIAFLILIR